MKHDAAALIAATHVHADYEQDEWEPVTDWDHFRVCEYREICKRAYMVGAEESEERVYWKGASVKLGCVTCTHFEDTGFGPS